MSDMAAPKISDSTREQREEYIRTEYACRADCENCGMCKVLKGKTPEIAFQDYIEGKIEITKIRL